MRDGDFPSVPGPTQALAHPALIPQLLFGSRPQSCQSLLGFCASVRVCHAALMAVSPCEAFRHPPSFHQRWETCQALTGSPKQTPSQSVMGAGAVTGALSPCPVPKPRCVPPAVPSLSHRLPAQPHRGFSSL